MAKVINCERGFAARGDSDDAVAAIRGQLATDNPDGQDGFRGPSRLLAGAGIR